MTKIVSFTVPGEPIGKGRPRFVKNGGCYTPKKTRDYQMLVALAYRSAANQSGFKSFGASPIAVYIDAYFAIPKSYSKKEHSECLNGYRYPSKKPDVDNIAKSICDALNGIAYNDDAQVVSLQIYKRYAESPRAEVRIESAEMIVGEHI